MNMNAALYVHMYICVCVAILIYNTWWFSLRKVVERVRET
jgi:hypothetical protein